MASGGCYILKKILVLSLCVILIAAFTFAACSKKSDDKTTTNSKDTTVQADDLENNNTEYGLETEDVTDKDGKTVTDAKGKAVTTDVAVVYKKDKKGITPIKIASLDTINLQTMILPSEEMTILLIKKEDSE